jgi:hypothetical protein
MVAAIMGIRHTPYAIRHKDVRFLSGKLSSLCQACVCDVWHTFNMALRKEDLIRPTPQLVVVPQVENIPPEKGQFAYAWALSHARRNHEVPDDLRFKKSTGLSFRDRSDVTAYAIHHRRELGDQVPHLVTEAVKSPMIYRGLSPADQKYVLEQAIAQGPKTRESLHEVMLDVAKNPRISNREWERLGYRTGDIDWADRQIANDPNL